MEFTDKEKMQAREELRKEFDFFVTPPEINQWIFFHYCENEGSDSIIKLIMKEYDVKECSATKCWWYSTTNNNILKISKKIGMRLNCLPCSESCVPDRFK